VHLVALVVQVQVGVGQEVEVQLGQMVVHEMELRWVRQRFEGEWEEGLQVDHVAVVLVQGPVGLAWVEQIVALLQLQATASVLMQLMMTVTIHPMPHPSSSTLACLPQIIRPILLLPFRLHHCCYPLHCCHHCCLHCSLSQ